MPLRLPAKKPHKYRAKATVIEGIRFASRREAACYQELRLLEQAGEIRNLRRQVRFVLMAPVIRDGFEHINAGVFERVSPIGHYVADFVFEERTGTGWRTVVEDAKGYRTALYVWKRRHFERQYGLVIREV